MVGNPVFGRGCVHGDDPWFPVAFFVEHANGGEDTCPVKLRVYNAFGYQPGNFPGQRFAASMLQRDIALHAKPTVPACFPTPSDQAGGPAEPISGQQNARAFRQPGANTFQKPSIAHATRLPLWSGAHAGLSGKAPVPHPHRYHQGFVTPVDPALVESRHNRLSGIMPGGEKAPLRKHTSPRRHRYGNYSKPVKCTDTGGPPSRYRAAGRLHFPSN